MHSRIINTKLKEKNDNLSAVIEAQIPNDNLWQFKNDLTYIHSSYN